MKSRAVHHTAVIVSDLERSLEFYHRVFGLAPEKVVEVPESGLRLAFLPIGDTRLELLCYSDNAEKSPGVVDHVAFTVDDAATFVDRLVGAGLAPEGSEPKRSSLGSKIFFFRGPDGEKLELFEEPEQN